MIKWTASFYVMINRTLNTFFPYIFSTRKPRRARKVLPLASLICGVVAPSSTPFSHPYGSAFRLMMMIPAPLSNANRTLFLYPPLIPTLPSTISFTELNTHTITPSHLSPSWYRCLVVSIVVDDSCHRGSLSLFGLPSAPPPHYVL